MLVAHVAEMKGGLKMIGYGDCCIWRVLDMQVLDMTSLGHGEFAMAILGYGSRGIWRALDMAKLGYGEAGHAER